MHLDQYTPAMMIWIGIGLGGQALFSARFLLQWLASEKAGRSTVPVAFWYFSIFGGLVLFAYAIHRGDPVFILGQGAGVFIYARNLYLIHRERRDSWATDNRSAQATVPSPEQDSSL